ncbi:winged helix-turn-helix domain-containing protein [Actinokineospora guangxiensis]|uniref:Winged helix-turn-helix domain-containing protein n=1 Tax=Actinokineospora guangxiensis TaxID=1490288 RepID=A0ABW0ERE4_9PSEU
MAAPLLIEPPARRVELTLHITADSDKVADLVDALRALGALDAAAEDFAESAERPGSRVIALPARSAPLRLDAAARRAYWHGEEITLTRLEFDLLHHLASAPNQVHRRRTLMREVWHTAYIGERTVDVHVRRLRGKFAAGEELIRTVRGVGYQLTDSRLVELA